MTTPSQGLMKMCNKCGTEKSILEFYPRSNGGVHSECKECTKQRSRDRVHGPNHREIRDRENSATREKRAKIKDAVFIAYGGYKCACCGETEPMFLSIDHIENNGAEHRREITGKRNSAGYHTYKWLYDNNFPEGYQVFCMNCNHGKRMNGGVCPHQARCNDQGINPIESSDSKRTASQEDEDMVCSLGKLKAVSG